MKHLETNWDRPLAKITLTAAEIALLVACSQRHYDAGCRNASDPIQAGFLLSWRNQIGVNPDDPLEITTQAGFSTIDLCCKVLETNAESFEKEAQFMERFTLRAQLAAVLTALNDFASKDAPLVEAPKKTGHDLPSDDPEPDYKALYYSLIYAVGKKYEGETRFDTALRYIRESEDSPRPGLQLRRKEDGLWLSVTLPSGSAAMVRIQQPNGEITKDILHQAATDDRPNQSKFSAPEQG